MIVRLWVCGVCECVGFVGVWGVWGLCVAGRCLRLNAHNILWSFTSMDKHVLRLIITQIKTKNEIIAPITKISGSILQNKEN